MRKRAEYPVRQTYGPQCGGSLALTRLDTLNTVDNALFMMETSGRSQLTARQACGVESAARKSGLAVHLILFSPLLDLTDNTTCQLYMSDTKIRFLTVDPAALARDTPLGKPSLRPAPPRPDQPG